MSDAMSPKEVRIIFTAVGLVWVGGWGFLMFRYPEFFAKTNARFGFRRFASPGYIKFLRRLGMVEMVLAGLSVLSTVVMFILGWST